MRDYHVFIQSRMGSTRLPGKALMDLDGDPMTRFMLKRLDALDPIVLCPDEDVTIFEKELSPWRIIGGDRDDVLARFRKAARLNPAKFYVRLTGDCPLVDPDWIRWVLACAMSGNHGYYGIANDPDGNDVQVIRADMFEQYKARDEHVTSFMSNAYPPFGGGGPKYSVDTQEDLDRVRRIVAALGRECTKDEILNYLEANP